MKARNFVAKHLHLNRPTVEQDRKKEEKKTGRYFNEEQLDLLDNAEQENENEAD